MRTESHDERTAVAWLLAFVRPHRARLVLVLALSLASTALGLAQPYITKFLIDDGLIAGNFAVIVRLSALMLAVGVLSTVLGGFNRWHYTDVSARILLGLREDVFAHLARLSPRFHARARGGDLFSRIDGDLAEVQRFAVDSLLAFVNGAIALLGALALMLSLSWELSLLALALLPVNWLFLRRMRPLVERLTRALRERTADVTAFFFETLGAIKFIQSVAAEDREGRRLRDLNRAFRGELLRLQMAGYATSAVPGLLIAISTAVVFVAGGYLTIEGTLSIGTLVAFSVYLARATGPIQTLQGLYVALQRARVSLRRVTEVTNVRPDVAPPPRARALRPHGGGAVRFEGVRFRYHDEGPEILRGVDLEIAAGAKIGLAGVSGVGKTTLIDLLSRHYDPQAGRILLDGVDLRELDLGELRRRVAVVAQDTVLFSGTVLENIRYAAPYASDEEVLDAARRAEVEQFVRDLPHGFESEIGARGAALSGGQRQRIAIARALLQEPLILVLDEATSAVDLGAEARIGTAIDELFPSRTRLVISHRPQALEGADRVLDLVDGRLIPRESPAAEADPCIAR